MAKAQLIIEQNAIMLAKYYFQIGKKIWDTVAKEEKKADNDIGYRTIVGNTNMAFSCEIMLKVIACQEGKTMDEIGICHDLEALFRLLSQQAKDSIRIKSIEVYNSKLPVNWYTENDFENDLREYKDSFVECRYWYEVPKAGEKGKKAGPLFIYSFSSALMENVMR